MESWQTIYVNNFIQGIQSVAPSVIQINHNQILIFGGVFSLFHYYHYFFIIIIIITITIIINYFIIIFLFI